MRCVTWQSLLAFIIAINWLSVTWAQIQPAVLIDFDHGAESALPPGWKWIVQSKTVAAGLDGNSPHSGRYSLRLSGSDYDSVARVGTNPIRDFTPTVGERYRVSLWCRSDRLDADAWVKIEFIDAEGKRVLGNFFLRPEPESHDWYLMEGVSPRVPEGTAEIWLNINLSGTGELWLDDFSLEPWAGGTEDSEAQRSPLPRVPPPPADADHPRIYFRPDDVESLRAKRRQIPFRQLSEMILARTAGIVVTPLPEEPEPYPDGWEVNHWRDMRQVASQVSGNMENLAFAYLITGDEMYAEEAKRWIKHVCSWDVGGTTSSAYHDDLGRWILSSMSAAVDWIYDTLTPEELALVRSVLLARGRELYRLQVRPLANQPFSSHAISSLCYLTRAALVLSDLPEAQEWLAFTARFYEDHYPPWGGKDGGWSEGVSYWKSSVAHALEAAELLKVAGVADLFAKDWYQNSGYFKMYFQPPGSKYANGFGDGAAFDVLSNSDYTAMIMFAVGAENGYFKWYAQQLQQRSGRWFDDYVRAYFFLLRYSDRLADLEAKPPTDLPRSKAFHDIGQVALHSDLLNARDDVSLYFKSSPLGSVSHSHGDQNSFTVSAWNEPLAISAGWYDWYGSDQHYLFNRQTRSKNTILVDGEGQHYRSIEASGEITAFFTGTGYDLTTGEAAKAYGGKLERFSRQILYCVPDYFLVIDDLKAPKPVHFNWLLHTLSPPQIDADAGILQVEQEGVYFRVGFLTPKELDFEQTDRYYSSGDARRVFKENEVPPETEKPPQYHVAATTRNPALGERFVTVLHPYKKSASPLAFAGTDRGDVYEVRATGEARRDLTLISMKGTASQLRGTGLEAEGCLASVSWVDDHPAKLLLYEGRTLQASDSVELHADQPCTASMEIDEREAHVVVVTEADETTLSLRFRQTPHLVMGDGQPLPDVVNEDGCVRLRLPRGRHTLRLSWR
ncbi:MAG: DUF4962 domain-containing protein [Limnochordia bacterium]|jgi:hypothetical protein